MAATKKFYVTKSTAALNPIGDNHRGDVVELDPTDERVKAFLEAGTISATKLKDDDEPAVEVPVLSQEIPTSEAAPPDL